jgi:hypothetical protein
MFEPIGEPGHREALGRLRHLALGPADRFGDAHGREHLGGRVGQHRIGPGHLGHRQVGAMALPYPGSEAEQNEDEDQESDENLAANAHGAKG